MLPKALPFEGEASASVMSSMPGQARSLAGRSLISGNSRNLKVRMLGKCASPEAPGGPHVYICACHLFVPVALGAPTGPHAS